MQLYLTIITTILVMTQIIRVSQNAMQLRHLGTVHKYDDYVHSVYVKLNRVLDTYIRNQIPGNYDGACEDCKHVDCDCDEEPCKSCMNNYVSSFELRDE